MLDEVKAEPLKIVEYEKMMDPTDKSVPSTTLSCPIFEAPPTIQYTLAADASFFSITADSGAIVRVPVIWKTHITSDTLPASSTTDRI